MRITDSHMMNLLDILSTSVENEWGQQMRIQILILGCKGLTLTALANVKHDSRITAEAKKIIG